MAAIGIAPCGTVIAEDIRDLQRWPGHAGGLRRLGPALLLRLPPPAAELAKRAFDGRDPAGGNARVARRRIELIMAKNGLNQTNIRAALQEMGGKAVPQRMQGNGLFNAGGVAGLMEEAVELACRQRLAVPASGKKPALHRGH